MARVQRTGWGKATLLVKGRDGVTKTVKGYKRSVYPVNKTAQPVSVRQRRAESDGRDRKT
jgi:hypothetical protein